MAAAENPNLPSPTPGRLDFTTASAPDGVRVVSLSGEIDHVTGDTLRDALHVSGPRPRIVADFTRVTFMDSSGINILITAHQELTEADGWLRLASPSSAVHRTITIVGLDAVIDCHPGVTEALAA
ncbi:STAS domain-containing protein [Streptomyces sp. NPDC055051]|uniref:STAS domain-containing protein n=1 Tax=Streptomyces sp. NPDC014861 TaxID=3364923 RepID=UPI0036F69B87